LPGDWNSPGKVSFKEEKIMPGLSVYKSRRIRVDLPTEDGEEPNFIELRALSLPDASILVDSHEHAITAIAMKIQNRRDLFERPGQDPEALNEIMADLAMELIRESPLLVGNLIALCSDEPAQLTAAIELPITVQIEAISVIAELTFKDIASVKKLIAGVTRMIRGFFPTRIETTA
jgi:hypothetical protein